MNSFVQGQSTWKIKYVRFARIQCHGGATWSCRTLGLSETIIVTIPLFLSKSTYATKLSANTGATMQGGLWY